jgi:MFS family permease
LSTAYSYWVLFVLFLISVLNYYDRNVVAIILQPMKLELRLSDTDAGLLSGPAFAVVYSLLGLPLARIADRGRRVSVLSVVLTIWSIMTAACGFAVNMTTMFLSRMGVGVGEAGALPATHALVADYFPAQRRASALSVIAIAGNLGIILASLAGGLVAARYGWRAAFWVGGGPGLVLALIAFLTIREPSRRKLALDAPPPVSPVPLGEAFAMLWRRPSFLFVTLGMTLASIGGYALQSWTPTFFIRTFGMSPGELGPIYGLLTGVPAIIGMLVGGVLMDRWIRRDRRALVWIQILTFSTAIPTSLVIFLSPSLKLAFAAVLINSLMTSIYVGPMYALIQGLAGAKIRATAAAVFMVVVNLIALSLGPLAAGFVSDKLKAIAGADSLRWSLCTMLVTYLLSLFFYLLAVRTVRADLDDADRS